MITTMHQLRSAVLFAALSAATLGWIQSAAAQTNDTTATAGETMGAEKQAATPVIVIETSAGTIKAELWPDKAPATVANILGYTADKFYDGTIFHRVIKGFMLQGGGFTPEMRQKPTKAPIRNEARKDTANARGTLAMARTGVIDSATSQFFINLVDNGFLNHENETPQGFGYCVFGKVTSGMDVVDAIANVKTGTVNGFENVPQPPVVITSIRLAD